MTPDPTSGTGGCGKSDVSRCAASGKTFQARLSARMPLDNQGGIEGWSARMYRTLATLCVAALLALAGCGGPGPAANTTAPDEDGDMLTPTDPAVGGSRVRGWTGTATSRESQQDDDTQGR